MRKAIVFGVGNRYRRFKDALFDEYQVIALADNDSYKQGLIMDGLPVIKPCAIQDLSYDVVLLTVQGNAVNDITEQLAQFCVPNSKIHVYDKKPSPFVIDPLFFSKDMTRDQKKYVFKNNVELLFLELSSQCNRSCWMCPNSMIDRHSKNIKLDHQTLIKVLAELREIDYDADISLSVFNEPMLDDDLDENIKIVKHFLPNAPVHFNTNGDYLTPKRLADLEKLGLDFLPISVYIDTIEKPWNYHEAVDCIEKKAKELGLKIESISAENCTTVDAVSKYKSLTIFYRNANHRIVACDRCDLLPAETPVFRNIEARRICDRFFTMFTINYSGVVMACCNFHPDFKRNEPFIVGDVNNESIFDIYMGEKWNQIRRQHIYDSSAQPCKTCGIISDLWMETSLTVTPYQPFRDRPRYRKRV